jgi:hypothetical protein
MAPWRVRDFHADDLDAVVRLWDNPAASGEASAFSLSDLIAAVRAHEPAVVRAGVVRGMQMDINPFWPVFVTYDPPTGAPAAPGNGSKLLPSTVQGPWTFFEARWARDFVTMSARPAR